MIEIVGSDIGGTLTRRDGSISERTLNVLRSLPVPLCLVTGFNRHVAFQYRDRLNRTSAYLVVQNGAFTYQGDRLLDRRLLDPGAAGEIVEFLLEGGMVARVFCSDNNVYCLVPDGYDRRMLRWDDPIYRIHDDPVGPLLDDVIQVCAFEPVDVVQGLLGAAKGRFGDLCIEGSLLFGTHQWIEFNHPRARKEVAFLDLLEQLSISPQNAMYCGDNFNDLQLLERVGWPVAVEDAPEAIRARARHVTGAGHADGIARFLAEQFKLEKR